MRHRGLILLLMVAMTAGTMLTQPARADTALLQGDADWASLTAAQKATLAPLKGQWHDLDEISRDKWVRMADRFPDLSADDQQRMQARMTQWSKLPPQQRGEARLRFQNTRQMSPAERQRSWAAYQALSPEERQDLARQARRKQAPVVLPAAEPGPREATQQALPRHSGKTNLVPHPQQGSPAPRAVAPTVVKAGRGATTTLVNEPPRPALHQQTGLPKINAARGFVDPQTLLPQRGLQGAGMTPSPEPQRD